MRVGLACDVPGGRPSARTITPTFWQSAAAYGGGRGAWNPPTLGEIAARHRKIQLTVSIPPARQRAGRRRVAPVERPGAHRASRWRAETSIRAVEGCDCDRIDGVRRSITPSRRVGVRVIPHVRRKAALEEPHRSSSRSGCREKNGSAGCPPTAALPLDGDGSAPRRCHSRKRTAAPFRPPFASDGCLARHVPRGARARVRASRGTARA